MINLRWSKINIGIRNSEFLKKKNLYLEVKKKKEGVNYKNNLYLERLPDKTIEFSGFSDFKLRWFSVKNKKSIYKTFFKNAFLDETFKISSIIFNMKKYKKIKKGVNKNYDKLDRSIKYFSHTKLNKKILYNMNFPNACNTYKVNKKFSKKLRIKFENPVFKTKSIFIFNNILNFYSFLSNDGKKKEKKFLYQKKTKFFEFSYYYPTISSRYMNSLICGSQNNNYIWKKGIRFKKAKRRRVIKLKPRYRKRWRTYNKKEDWNLFLYPFSMGEFTSYFLFNSMEALGVFNKNIYRYFYKNWAYKFFEENDEFKCNIELIFMHFLKNFYLSDLMVWNGYIPNKLYTEIYNKKFSRNVGYPILRNKEHKIYNSRQMYFNISFPQMYVLEPISQNLGLNNVFNFIKKKQMFKFKKKYIISYFNSNKTTKYTVLRNTVKVEKDNLFFMLCRKNNLNSRFISQIKFHRYNFFANFFMTYFYNNFKISNKIKVKKVLNFKIFSVISLYSYKIANKNFRYFKSSFKQNMYKITPRTDGILNKRINRLKVHFKKKIKSNKVKPFLSYFKSKIKLVNTFYKPSKKLVYNRKMIKKVTSRVYIKNASPYTEYGYKIINSKRFGMHNKTIWSKGNHKFVPVFQIIFFSFFSTYMKNNNLFDKKSEFINFLFNNKTDKNRIFFFNKYININFLKENFNILSVVVSDFFPTYKDVCFRCNTATIFRDSMNDFYQIKPDLALQHFKLVMPNLYKHN